MNILIVDDEPRSREGLARMVSKEGTAVVWTADSGEEGLARAEERRPDGLLLDINMPGMDGLVMLSRLRENHPDLPVLIVTGYNEFSYAKRAIDLGVLGFLLKPVSEEDLREGLEKIADSISRSRKADLMREWSRRELSDNMESHRRQFFSDLLSGLVHGRELELRLKALELEGFREGWLLLSRSPSPAPETSVPENPVEASCILESIVEEYRAALLTGAFWSERTKGEALAAWNSLTGEKTGVKETHLMRIRLGWEDVCSCRLQLQRAFDAPGTPLIRAAKNLVEQHYGEQDFSMKKAAVLLEVSSCHLSREFKRSTGRAFTEYLTDHRIRAAAEELERAEPAVKIYEIADRCGFKNQHYFSRVFREVTGLSPKEYRR